MSHRPSRFKNILSLNNKYTKPAIFVLGFVLVGIVAFVITRAATPTATYEVEGGSRTGAITLVSDGDASNGTAIQFGEVVTTPGNSTCPTYPDFPSSDCTGYVHTGVTLKTCDQYISGGNFVISGTAGGTVVDGCDFFGRQVVIKGGGAVTLKRSRVRYNGFQDTGAAAIYISNGAGPVTIEDVEVTTTDNSVTDETKRQDRTIAVDKNNTQPVTIRRVYAHDTIRSMDITGQNNITIEDSFFGPNYNPGTGERKHSSGIRAAGGVYNVLIKNTYFEMGTNSFASGILATYPENGANHDITIDGGLWVIRPGNDGTYGIAAGYTKSNEQQNYNFTVKNLQISTQYYSSGCPSGCAQNWNQSGNSAIGPLGGTKIWQNVTKYNPGKSDHGQAILPN